MADLKKYKYQLLATSVGIAGIPYKKSAEKKVVFEPSAEKWLKVSNEIIAAFKDGHLEMTKDSEKAYKADLGKGTEAKAKAESKDNK